LLDNIAELEVRFILFELLSELLYLSEARVEISLGLFPILFNLFLPVKFLLHGFDLQLKVLVFLIPLEFLFSKELCFGVLLKIQAFDILVQL